MASSTTSDRMQESSVGTPEYFIGPYVWDKRSTPCRMLKKAVQQGRRRVETGGVPSGVR